MDDLAKMGLTIREDGAVTELKDDSNIPAEIAAAQRELYESVNAEYGERKEDTRSNHDRIIAYCAKEKIDPIYFHFYDLWVLTKSGRINLLATYKKHEKHFKKRKAIRDAKSRPHVCPENNPCHAPANNGLNHDQRRKVRHKTKNQNINFFCKTLTAGGELKGPRKIRKAVVKYRLTQMASQMPPVTAQMPENEADAFSGQVLTRHDA